MKRLILFSVFLFTGCTHDPCDRGQRYAHGLCYAVVDGGVDPDATPDDAP
jgi:hypothetical protein